MKTIDSSKPTKPSKHSSILPPSTAATQRAADLRSQAETLLSDSTLDPLDARINADALLAEAQAWEDYYTSGNESRAIAADSTRKETFSP